MKISISISEEDVRFLDAYRSSHQLRSRSAAIATAVRALKSSDLKSDYGQAWSEWSGTEDAALWDSTSGDGL